MIIAIDFDSTLSIGSFPGLGQPRMWLIEKAKQWRKDGHKLILWTCREDVHVGERACFRPRLYLTEAIEFCRSYGLEFDAVNCSIDELNNKDLKWARKIFADVYIDDKSAIFTDDTMKIVVNPMLCVGNLLND
jgi:hypothetical protein